jgi:hypothetical protein
VEGRRRIYVYDVGGRAINCCWVVYSIGVITGVVNRTEEKTVCVVETGASRKKRFKAGEFRLNSTRLSGMVG